MYESCLNKKYFYALCFDFFMSKAVHKKFFSNLNLKSQVSATSPKEIHTTIHFSLILNMLLLLCKFYFLIYSPIKEGPPENVLSELQNY